MTTNEKTKNEKTKKQNRYLIAGVDAGITTAFALIDLDGNLIKAESHKNISDEKIIQKMIKYGTIILIASDTNPPSHFVKKIASRLRAKIYSPKKSLTQEQKRIISSKVSSKATSKTSKLKSKSKSKLPTNDPHIRDAYSAAIKAYHRFENRLRRLAKQNIDDSKRMRIVIGKRAKG